MGRRQAQRDDARPRPTHERRDRPPPRKRARNARSRCRGPDRTSGASRGKPVVRRAVRRALRRAGLDGRPRRSRDAPGHHRRPPGRSQPDEKSIMLDAAVVGKVFWTGALGRHDGTENGVPLARAERLRSATEAVFGRRRERVRVCARACPRRRLRADPARRARHEAPERRRVARVLGRPEDHAEMRAYHWRSALDLARAAAPTTPISSTAHASPCATQATARPRSTTMPQPHALRRRARALAGGRQRTPELLFRLAVALHEAYDEARQQDVLSRPPAMPCLQSATRNAPPRRRHTSHASSGIAVRMRLVREHLGRAEALAGESTSVAAARVLAFSARIRNIAGETEEAQPLAEAAFAMATELGLEELRAHALTTIGMTKNDLDFGPAPPTWSAHSRSPLRRTRRSRQRPSTISPSTRRSPPSSTHREALDEAMRLAERYGDASAIRFIRGNRVWLDLMLGCWDVALESADAFIAECEAGSPHTMEPFVREVRAAVSDRTRRPGRGVTRPDVRWNGPRRGTSRFTGSAPWPAARHSTSRSGESTKRERWPSRSLRSFARSGSTARSRHGSGRTPRSSGSSTSSARPWRSERGRHSRSGDALMEHVLAGELDASPRTSWRRRGTR